MSIFVTVISILGFSLITLDHSRPWTCSNTVHDLVHIVFVYITSYYVDLFFFAFICIFSNYVYSDLYYTKFIGVEKD